MERRNLLLSKFGKPDDDDNDDEAEQNGEPERAIDMHNTGLGCTSHSTKERAQRQLNTMM